MKGEEMKGKARKSKAIWLGAVLLVLAGAWGAGHLSVKNEPPRKLLRVSCYA